MGADKWLGELWGDVSGALVSTRLDIVQMQTGETGEVEDTYRVQLRLYGDRMGGLKPQVWT